MKDAYWLAVDYGIVVQARALGVDVDVYEAGGYLNLARSQEQIEQCVAAGAQAVLLGAIDYHALNPLIAELRARGVPTVDLVNGVSSPDVAAKSLVSFRDMARSIGEYLVRRYEGRPAPVRVAWFPGPKGAGWVEQGDAGLRAAFAGTPLKIVATAHGDTGFEAQAALIEETLAAHPDIDVIVGTAVTAEVAVRLLAQRPADAPPIEVAAYYLTPGVYRGIRSGAIVAAPTDSPVLQGRIAVDQAVRLLEGKPLQADVGPIIQVIDRITIAAYPLDAAIAPAGFRATMTVR